MSPVPENENPLGAEVKKPLGHVNFLGRRSKNLWGGKRFLGAEVKKIFGAEIFFLERNKKSPPQNPEKKHWYEDRINGTEIRNI